MSKLESPVWLKFDDISVHLDSFVPRKAGEACEGLNCPVR